MVYANIIINCYKLVSRFIIDTEIILFYELETCQRYKIHGNNPALSK